MDEEDARVLGEEVGELLGVSELLLGVNLGRLRHLEDEAGKHSLNRRRWLLPLNKDMSS